MLDKTFSEDDMRLIRGLGNTKGGLALLEYLEYEREGYLNEVLYCKAEDTASVAHGQAGAELAKKLIGLLKSEIRDILAEHNIEEQKDE